MQLLNLELDHFNLFCPATGIQVLSEDYCNEDAPSTMGYWLDEFLTEPTISNEKLKEAWDVFYSNYKKKHQKQPNLQAIESFLVIYPEPNWVIFKIKNQSISGGSIFDTVYHVLDMNTKIKI